MKIALPAGATLTTAVAAFTCQGLTTDEVFPLARRAMLLTFEKYAP